MTKTQRIDITAITANAMAQLNPRAVERLYAQAAFPASMPNVKLKLPRSGTAEQYIVATHALRLIQASTEESRKELFRAVDRKTYDLTTQAIAAAHGAPVQIQACVPHPSTVPAHTFAYRAMLAATLLSMAGAEIVQDDAYDVVVGGLMRSQAGLIGAKTYRTPSDDEVKSARIYFGLFPVDGWFDLSNRFDGAEGFDTISALEFAFDAEGLDIADYTAGVQLTERDAALLMSSGYSVNPAVSAAALLISRAVAKDRAYSIQRILARDPAAIVSAEIAQKKAESNASAAESRAAAAEEHILHQQRKIDKLQSALEAQQADAQELAALRDALWRGAQQAENSSEPSAQPRDLPNGIVVVGGHATWARRLTEQLPTIRAWPSGTTCPSSVIASAAELWIQAAYMAHKDFYAIINVARSNHVPVHYFSGTGVGSSVADLTHKEG